MLNYSIRTADIGSTRTARMTGMAPPKMAIAAVRAAAVISVGRSWTRTENNQWDKTRAASSDTAVPASNPHRELVVPRIEPASTDDWDTHRAKVTPTHAVDRGPGQIFRI